MKLRTAQIIGFQSFADTGVIEFGDGINLIVGQNNAGKSALLRAISGGMFDDRHRTPEAWRQELIRVPLTELAVELTVAEFHLAVVRHGPVQFPAPADEPPTHFAERVLARGSLPAVFSIGQLGQGTSHYPSHRLFQVQPGHNPQFTNIAIATNNTLTFSDSGGAHDNLWSVAAEFWKSATFYFTAERMSVGEGQHGHARRLNPNASNLPAALHTLNGDRGDVFRKLVEHLREVFPTVGNLSVRPRPDNNLLEVRIWPTVEMARPELSFPLSQSGTGVSQVIALLTAIMTVDNSVVIIDEINTFLHPAAVKALLRILQTEYPQHQYIVSTHSPEVISFSNPSTVHLVTRDGYESQIKKLDLNQIEDFREVAEHLGISMSDVFAAERIVWVEGPTEELCFPLLYKHAAHRPLPRGTMFTSVVATGDFVARRRDRTLIYEIYARLSAAANPLVTTAAFSFDSEELSEGEKADMIRTSRALVHFLPRRHLECYLMDPDAIAAYVRSKDGASGALTAEEIALLLGSLAESQFHIKEWAGDISDARWLSSVDAAKLIKAACLEASEQRVSFDKKADTLFLLKYILDNRPDVLADLCSYVQGLVDNGPRVAA